MRDFIKKVLSEHVKTKKVLNEMAKRDWCTDFDKKSPEYHFCTAAESYIQNELEDVPSGKGRRKKKIFKDFEDGLRKFFETVKDNSEISKRLIRIDIASPIYQEGKIEMEKAIELLKPNCSKIEMVIQKKLKEFEEDVKLYFLDGEKYSIENRLPTNYSALSVLFTKFFSNKGAFDGVHADGHDWTKIAKEWITHSFHPYHPFLDIRPLENKSQKITSLNFSELARIYFSNDIVFNSDDIRKSVMKVLEGVRGMGFESEDKFENLYLRDKKDFRRFARDYGFVDMYTGIDFIYLGKKGYWIPIQVKTTAKEPTYLISTLGCKEYIIAEKYGQKFKIDQFPKPYELPH